MKRLRSAPVVEKINHFLYSPAYFFVVGGLTVLSNVFCAELLVYLCFVSVGIYLCLLGRDLLPLMPMVICGYITPSVSNNPGLNDASIFAFDRGGLYMLILIGLLLMCLIYRLATDETFGGKAFFTRKRILLSGLLLLGGAYALSGIGSGQLAQFGQQNLLFAFLQFAALALMYYLLSGAVRWDLAPKAYLAWTGVCVGYVLLIELIAIYIKADVIANGVIVRERIFTGWGHYNNIGALLAMMIPCPFFLTGKGRYSGIFYISAMLFLGGLIFTCSRSSIFVGVGIYLASYIISLFHSRRARANIAIHIFSGLLVITAILLFHENLFRLFSSLTQIGLTSSDRKYTYILGIEQFTRFPIFGGSFFPTEQTLYNWSTSESFIAFFPPRWHNTVIQLLASCGAVGLFAYVYHRIQTVRLFLVNPSGKKLFFALSILALLLTSMLDCHLFNVGPALFYSMMLAFAEHKLNTPSPAKK